MAIDEVQPTPNQPERMSKFLLHSAILPDDRVVSVYLPAAYFIDPIRRFPVFYLHDGQNLFDPETSYIPGKTWRADSTADRLTAEGQIEPIILVGIANTGVRRMAEYTPTKDPHLGGGEADSYGRLIAEELKPWIDRTFRTKPEAPVTGLGGSSLGGLVSLYLGLTRPETFGRIAILSPSIWWDHRSILTTLTGFRSKLPLRIWLDMGTAEGARHVRDTDFVHRLLLRRGWRDGLDLSYQLIPGGVHSEEAWASRLDKVLVFLYSRTS
jgi:predicted alpha/beta superfamily hydrolase